MQSFFVLNKRLFSIFYDCIRKNIYICPMFNLNKSRAMKKLSFLLMGISMFAFVACAGDKTEEAVVEETVATEVVEKEVVEEEVVAEEATTDETAKEVQ